MVKEATPIQGVASFAILKRKYFGEKARTNDLTTETQSTLRGIL
jgi:hypothetical protein